MNTSALTPEVRFKRKDVSTSIPAYKTAGSAGCDICSNERAVVHSGCRVLVSTGLYIEVPPGYECQIRPRSGMAFTHGVTVFNSPGTVDSDYRGEMKILLFNASDNPFLIEPGDRIAQLVFAPVTQVEFTEVSELSETDRGAGGWGSTGVR